MGKLGYLLLTSVLLIAVIANQPLPHKAQYPSETLAPIVQESSCSLTPTVHEHFPETEAGLILPARSRPRPTDPPEPTPTIISTEPEPTHTDSTKATLKRNEAEYDLILDIVALEGWHPHGYDGYLAIATVIMNRVAVDRFPDTPTAVVSQKGQFCTYVSDRTPHITEDTIRAVEDALYHGARNLPENILFFCTKEAYNRSSFFQSLEVYKYEFGHVWAYYGNES